MLGLISHRSALNGGARDSFKDLSAFHFLRQKICLIFVNFYLHDNNNNQISLKECPSTKNLRIHIFAFLDRNNFEHPWIKKITLKRKRRWTELETCWNPGPSCRTGQSINHEELRTCVAIRFTYSRLIIMIIFKQKVINLRSKFG